MDILILAISIFLIIGILCWKFTKKQLQKEEKSKSAHLWTSRTFYWQGILFIATGGTFLILFLLKANHIIHF